MFAGEFTQENQRKIKDEEEKDRAKIDPWKVRLIIANMYLSLILVSSFYRLTKSFRLCFSKWSSHRIKENSGARVSKFLQFS